MILDDLIRDNKVFKQQSLINNITIKHRHLGINLVFNPNQDSQAMTQSSRTRCRSLLYSSFTIFEPQSRLRIVSRPRIPVYSSCFGLLFHHYAPDTHKLALIPSG
jgi:hypothetical protein